MVLGILCAPQVQAQVITSLPVFRDTSFQGSFVSQSEADPIHITAGESKIIVVRLKNTGKTNWEANGKNFVSVYTVDPNYHKSLFAGSSWRENDSPIKLEKIVKPSEVGDFPITLTAPANQGEYIEKFFLAAENKTWIKGTGFYVKIIVDASQVVSTPVQIPDPVPQNIPVTDNSSSTALPDNSVASVSSSDTTTTSASFSVLTTRVPISEPTIRVGLFKSPDPIKFQAPFQYQVYAQDEFLGTIEADQMATVRYVNGTYTVTTPGGTFSSTKYLRLIPLDPANYFILPEYSRPYSAYKKNFNTYRGTLEYRFSPKSSQPYLINELPLDEYVAGVTETSNDSPIEYIKALVIAERSYGYVRIGSDIFDVYPNTTDQLYLGYNFEVGAGRIAQAVQDTRGEMVTYQGALVNTPYFSRSNGMTKSAKAVWGQDRAWLQPVEALYDKGKTMNGHGVGMSNADAGQRASKDGWNYLQILKHYYTGVEVEKVF